MAEVSIFQLPNFQQIIARHTEKQENMAQTKEENKSPETNTEYSLEELMLKQKLQYFGHLMQRSYSFHSLEKTLMMGKIESKRTRGLQRT